MRGPVHYRGWPRGWEALERENVELRSSKIATLEGPAKFLSINASKPPGPTRSVQSNEGIVPAPPAALVRGPRTKG